MPLSQRYILGLMLTALASLGVVGVVAAPPTGGGVPSAQDVLTGSEDPRFQLLGPEFKDEIRGFRVHPPAGCRLIEKAGMEHVSFIHDNKQWAGSVATELFKPAEFSVEQYLKNSATELNQSFKAVQILESRTVLVSSKSAAKFTASFEAVGTVKEGSGKDTKKVEVGSVSLFKQVLAVQTAANQYLVLTLVGPLATKAELSAAFDAMASTFQVYNQEQITQRRVAAIKAGKDWIADRTAEQLAKTLVITPQFFRVRVDGKDVGFIRFDEAQDTFLNFKGVSVYVNACSFPSDGSTIVTRSRNFWAFARQPKTPQETTQFSIWENSIGNITFVGNNSSTQWTTESGTMQFEIPFKDAAASLDAKDAEVRGGQYMINVTRNAGVDRQPLLTEQTTRPMQWPISLNGPAPLPKTLEYLWPRLVDLSKPTRLAFVVFNSAAKPPKLGLRTLSVIGPETVIVDGRSVNAVKLTDDIDPGSTTLWVDNTGKTLMMRTSDNSFLLPTTSDKINQLWGQRIKQAATAKPVPSPTPTSGR